MIKFIPRVFTSYSVNAIRSGIKTQTRRIFKPQPEACPGTNGFMPIHDWIAQGEEKIQRGLTMVHTEGPGKGLIFPAYKSNVGDIIWVKETWAHHPKEGYLYKATDILNDSIEYNLKWKPPRFMPKVACRNFLKVVSVRAERLQDITQEDAKAEGVFPCPHRPASTECKKWLNNSFKSDCYVCSYRVTWQQINHNWDDNPWVSVEIFEQIPQPDNFLIQK